MKNENSRINDKYTYRCILDTVPNPIIEVDQNLVITLANREALKWWPQIIEGISHSYDVLSYDNETKGDTAIITKTLELKEPQTTEIETKEGEFFNIKTNYVEDRDSRRIIVHILDITGRKWAEKALQQSKEQYRLLFESAPDAVSILDTRGVITMCSRTATMLYGYTREEMVGKHMTDLMRPSSIQQFHEKFRLLQRLQPAEGEIQVIKRNGSTIDIWRKEVPLTDENGKFTGVLGYDRDMTERKKAEAELANYRAHLEESVKERTAELRTANEELQQEITERKRVEDELKTSLQEKEILLKEIHHRVKNNLQIISSLLSLQSGYIADEKAIQVFKNCRERVRTMSLVHEELYRSRSLSNIDFHEYVERLVGHLFDSYSLDAGQVKLTTDIVDKFFDIETTIPLGLLLNELITNSLKYAFPNGKKGELYISLEDSKDEKYDHTLIVGDSGAGLSKEIDFQESQTLGMVLVGTLVKQLHGTIECKTEGGARFIINFKRLLPKTAGKSP